MKNGYDVYLDKCLLPITPSKIQMKINNANKTITLINEGEINLLKQAKLTDIEFECTIPQVKYPFAVYKSGFKEAAYFLNYFEHLKTGKKPFQFIVSRQFPNGTALFNTNIKVSLEEYTITEDVKNGFDLTVKIKLKQYRDFSTKTVDVQIVESKPKAVVQSQRPTETSPTPQSNQMYTVVPGDCLWNIAKRFYGTGTKETIIYEANRDVIGSNKNLIYPGQVFVIPAI